MPADRPQQLPIWPQGCDPLLVRDPRLWVLLVAAVGLTECKGSVSAEMHTQADQVDVADTDEPMQATADQGSGLGEEGLADRALLGARHDLALAGENPSPSCACLAVVAGFPSNPAFFWQSVVPVIDADSQVVIAFTSDGIGCDRQAEGSLGASYWGYQRVGDDVVVFIENAMPGRPVTTGAIIPRPSGNGALYVEPRDNNVPYGRSMEGTGKRCRVEITTNAQRAVPLPTAPASEPY
jgi:hypothetical protein